MSHFPWETVILYWLSSESAKPMFSEATFHCHLCKSLCWAPVLGFPSVLLSECLLSQCCISSYLRGNDLEHCHLNSVHLQLSSVHLQFPWAIWVCIELLSSHNLDVDLLCCFLWAAVQCGYWASGDFSRACLLQECLLFYFECFKIISLVELVI